MVDQGLAKERAVVEHALADLGTSIGLDIQLSDAGTCGLRYDDQLDCYLELAPDGHRLLAYAPLIEVTDSTKSALMEKAMTLNLFARATGGACLAYDQNEQKVQLCANWPVDHLDGLGLRNLLANFVGVATRLTKVLEEAGHSRTTDQPKTELPQSAADLRV